MTQSTTDPTSRVTVTDLPIGMLTEQTSTITAMLAGAARSLLPFQRNQTNRVIQQTVAPPSARLLDAYRRWSRSDHHYQHEIPPHLVCGKITLPLVSRLTAQSPYPLLGVLNQGIRLQMHAPLPANETIQLQGQLLDASDDGFSARIHSQVKVGTASTPHAMTVDAMAVVVLKKRSSRKQLPPDDTEYETVGHWQAAANEGQTFFWLTGDFNPIHTLPIFARRTRFGGCIMHGYGAFAQVFSQLANAGPRINDIETRFIRPLPLPSPHLQIQRGITPNEQGRIPFRLIDDAMNIYQAGSYQTETATSKQGTRP